MTLTDDQIWQLHQQWEKEGRPILVRPFDDKRADDGLGWRYYVEDNGVSALIPAIVIPLERYEQTREGTVIYCDQDEITELIKLGTDGKHTIPNMPFETIELRIVGDTMLREIKIFKTTDDCLTCEFFEYDEFYNKQDNHKLVEWRGYTGLREYNGELINCADAASFLNMPKRVHKYQGKEMNAQEMYEKLYPIDANDRDSMFTCYVQGLMNRAILVGLCEKINSIQPNKASPMMRKITEIENKEFVNRQKELAKRCKMIGQGNTGTVATGQGTKHSYRYEVRGHWRNTENGIIWVNPHKRGEGEEDKSPYVLTDSVKEIVKKNGYFLKQKLVKMDASKGLRKFTKKAMNWLVTLFRKEIVLDRKPL